MLSYKYTYGKRITMWITLAPVENAENVSGGVFETLFEGTASGGVAAVLTGELIALRYT
jgi:hypothetical protein